MFLNNLPSSLRGLTHSELLEISLLPWKRGSLLDIKEAHSNLTFLLVSGKLEDSDKGLIGPGKEILGVKPFFKQHQRKYLARYYSEILYINTDHLIKFFFKNPMAFRSYMLSEINSGAEPLAEWSHLSNIWGVVSNKASSESIHFSIGLCTYLKKDVELKKKVIYLEYQKEGISLFTLLNKKPPPAFVQIDNASNNIKELLEERIVPISNNLDSLNVQFLSPWKITYDTWIGLYWELEKKYDEIVLHLGNNDEVDFFLKDCNTVFCVTSNKERTLNIFNPEKNTTFWPRTIEILHNNVTNTMENSISYPIQLGEQEIQDIISHMPYTYQKDQKYWKWFEKSIAPKIKLDHVLIFADYFDNFAGFIAYIQELWKNLDLPLEASLDNKILFLQGKSGILGSIALLSKNWEDFYKKCKRLEDYDISTLFRPIFPKTGLFSDKPIRKYLENLFKNIVLDDLIAVLPTISYNNHDLLLVSSGKISDNLLKSVFVHGFIEQEENNNEEYRALGTTSKNEWDRLLSWSFRLGYEQVTFIDFEQPIQKIDNPRLSRKLSMERISSTSFHHLTGYMSSVRSVSASNKKFLNDQIKDILQYKPD